MNLPNGRRRIALRLSGHLPNEIPRDVDHSCGTHPCGHLLIERPTSADQTVDRLQWDATNGRHLPMTTNDENAETRP